MAQYGGFGALYVGDLNPDVSEALLYQIFSNVGSVASVRVCRDAASRRSLGYAYVNYHQAEHADKAREILNGTKINARPCRVMLSQRDPALRKSQVGNIFVKGLPTNIDIKTLHDMFSVHGNILSCKVVTDKQGKSLGYGFVHFEKDEDARNAIAVNNDKLRNLLVRNFPESWDERALRSAFEEFGQVELASIDDKQGKTADKRKANVWMGNKDLAKKAAEALHRKTIEELVLDVTHQGIECMPFISKKKRLTGPGTAGSVSSAETKDLWVASLQSDVTPDDVHDLFNEKAQIYIEKKKVDLRIPRPGAKFRAETNEGPIFVTVDIPGKSPVCYAIVECNTREDAHQGLQGTNQQLYRGYYLRVDWRKSRQELEAAKEDRRRERQPRNLFVRGFPESWDEKHLKSVFDQFGTVESWLIDDKAGKSRASRKAYVCMATKEQADRAVDDLNNKDIEGGVMFVVHHKSRNELRERLNPALPEANIYVKYLPESWTEEKFRSEFGKFGTVVSARVAMDGGKSRGFGFVSYASPQEALQAITMMHNRPIEDGKHPLYVQLHQKRDIRRRLLEDQYRKTTNPVPPGAYPSYGRSYMYPQMMRARFPPIAYPQYYSRLQEQMQQMAYYHPAAAAAVPPQQIMPQHQRFHLQPAPVRYPIDQSRGIPQRMRPVDPTATRKRAQIPPQPAQQRVRISEQLARLPPQHQKQWLGEQLYPKISALKPNQAGKITGMLLEMENNEILELLQDNDLLKSRVDEAVEVLLTAQTDNGDSQ